MKCSKKTSEVFHDLMLNLLALPQTLPAREEGFEVGLVLK